MFIYNVTVKIDHSVHNEWLKWMKEIHIPEVLATNLFIKNEMYKINIDDEDGISYSIQYHCSNNENLMNYYHNFAPELQKKHTEKFKDKYVAFRTVLEKV